LNDKIIINKSAKKILIDYYGQENINDARLKMAKLPSKAILLNNPITSAPGFMVENIIVMAGVPKIMRSMFNSSLEFLDFGDKILSKEITLNITESVIASDLSKLQKKYPDVTIGSYPFFGGTSVVFRSFDKNKINQCYNIVANKKYE
jgi:molybdopterin-biosynthesis enzyme MoeA-like protein